MRGGAPTMSCALYVSARHRPGSAQLRLTRRIAGPGRSPARRRCSSEGRRRRQPRTSAGGARAGPIRTAAALNRRARNEAPQPHFRTQGFRRPFVAPVGRRRRAHHGDWAAAVPGGLSAATCRCPDAPRVVADPSVLNPAAEPRPGPRLAVACRFRRVAARSRLRWASRRYVGSGDPGPPPGRVVTSPA
ncbi:hypothetical protein GZL_09404 [Streptomyces sp. 769]|nr:hypothetical protein GZL_00009 [Streptomyces sp. 769]AJC61922.1 hypothetical protein GZL_09404 [Streptomyces sp. 769]